MPELPIFEYLAKQTEQPAEPRVFRVSEINRLVRQNLESSWRDLHVQGELSDVHRSSPGHIYFTVNDEDNSAQLRGVIFRGEAARCLDAFRDGARVELRGNLSLYVPRGMFQFVAQSAKPIGDGDLAARFEALRKKLEAEGLFDPMRKRKLPRCPRRIGVISSISGAALQDIIRVALKRCPVHIIVADCRVQGDQAPASIVAALQRMQRWQNVDVVIIARGGGSAEDLWAFNDEGVARAIAGFPIPTISGVGHEVDITIADLVADLRAATPSNAAELAIPEHLMLQTELRNHQRHLMRAMETQVGRLRLICERQRHALEDPRRQLAGVRGRLHNLQTRLIERTRGQLHSHRRLLAQHRELIAAHSPSDRLARQREQLAHRRAVLREHGKRLLSEKRSRLSTLIGKVDALSPLKVLERGYAIATLTDSSTAVRSVSEVKDGTLLQVRVADGTFNARVEREHS